MTVQSTGPDRATLDQITAPAGRAGQATMVESARAVAEVQGAIVVAQQLPRDLGRAEAEMQRSCSRMAMAERAFFSFPRAGARVTGPTVHLARELARCWGNLQYGVTELSRDDTAGESQMLAYAWDVEANVRPQTTFIVKHVRDTRDGPQRLVDLRDIYENNANNGARRLREQIFAVLPQWLTEEAQRLCRRTLEAGDGSSIEDRIGKALEAWARVGVTEPMLVDRLGAPAVAWRPTDLATLAVLWQTIDRGESTVGAEFDLSAGQRRTPLHDIAAEPAAAGRAVQVAPTAERSDGVADRPVEDVRLPEPGEQPARAERTSPPRPPDDRPATRVQQAAIRTLFGDLGVGASGVAQVLGEVTGGRCDVVEQLTRTEAVLVLDNGRTVADRLGLLASPDAQPSEAEQAAAFEAEQAAQQRVLAADDAEFAAGEQGDPWGAPAGGDQA